MKKEIKTFLGNTYSLWLMGEAILKAVNCVDVTTQKQESPRKLQ